MHWTNVKTACPVGRCLNHRHTENATLRFGRFQRVLFAGDSMAGQLYAAFKCNAERFKWTSKQQTNMPRLPLPRLFWDWQAISFGWMNFYSRVSLANMTSEHEIGAPRRFKSHPDLLIVCFGAWYREPQYVGKTKNSEPRQWLFEQHLAEAVAHLEEICRSELVVCVLATTSAKHFRGTGTFSEAVVDQCGREVNSTSRPRSACGTKAEAAAGNAWHVNAARRAVHAAQRVRLFDFFKPTLEWHDLHPGYQENYHGARCDCHHFCYRADRWEGLLHELAAASAV